MQRILNKRLLDKFIKFLFVGGMATIVNYATFYILFAFLFVNYILASIIGYVTGIFFSYYLNKNWTYKVGKESENIFIHKYIIVFLLSLVANTITLKILVEVFGIYPLIANIIAIGQSTITNFVGTTLLVFKDKKENA